MKSVRLKKIAKHVQFSFKGSHAILGEQAEFNELKVTFP